MRAKYNSERSVALQRMFPETAKINVRKTASNGRGGPRVFHTMLNSAIRTKSPMAITDPDLFGQVKATMDALTADWVHGHEGGCAGAG